MSQPSAEPPTNGSLAAEPQDQPHPTGSPPTKRKLSFDSVPSSQPQEEERQKKETPVLPAAAKKAREPIYGLKKRLDDALAPVEALIDSIEKDENINEEVKSNMRAQLAERITDAWRLFPMYASTFEDRVVSAAWEAAVKQMHLANSLVVAILYKDCEALGVKPCFAISRDVAE